MAVRSKRVVIVGGGYAGFSLARALDQDTDVVLVEPRDRFVHNVAAIRAVVEPALFDRIALPYDRLLKRGSVVRDRAIAVTGRLVTLASGQTLEADAVVVATGSHYANPFKPGSDNTAAMGEALRHAHDLVAGAKSIAIVGAGAVGTELAGEIATAMPNRKIALVSSTPTLFPGYSPKLGATLARQLTRMGVTLHLGAMAGALTSTDAPHAGTLKLSTGETLSPDVIFPAIGARPEAGPLGKISGIAFDRLGRAIVDGWLRPSSDPMLFALGDVAAAGDAMTIVAIMRQQPWLAKTLKAALAGRRVEALPKYAHWPLSPILVPLGPRKGASVLPITSNGLVVGPFLTSTIKGKALFIPRYHKEFNIA